MPASLAAVGVVAGIGLASLTSGRPPRVLKSGNPTMKLTSWTATAHGRAIVIEGTDDGGMPRTLEDVAAIVNDARRGTTIARRKPGADVSEFPIEVRLS